MKNFGKERQKEFVLYQHVGEKAPIYLDSAATSLKPSVVLEAEKTYYAEFGANIHRGVYGMSVRATEEYERVREVVQTFIDATSPEEIVFTKGATESLNLLAYSIGMLLQPGDEIIVSGMEHHANIVPWTQLADTKGVLLKYIPLREDGSLDREAYTALLTPKVKVVSVTHVSNVLGTIQPLKEIFAEAHAMGAWCIADGSQAVMHMPVSVQEVDADFYVCTGHKMFGPTGTGILYGKKHLLDTLPPYQTGGDMIESVSFEHVTFKKAPWKFEAGTPNIAGIIALGKAITYIELLGWEEIMQHEATLLEEAISLLSQFPEVEILALHQERIPLLSFIVKNAHPHDIGSIFDSHGICVRTGHHCAEPLMKHFQIPATTRISLSVYNTKEELQRLVPALGQCISLFS